MPLVAINVPNLVSGVSQQPSTLRLATSCSELVNGWPSIVTGLSKRPPSEWVANLSLTPSVNAGCYLIDRDADYQYIVFIDGADLKVFDLDGVPQTVRFPHGKAYLSQANESSTDFRFVTIGDTTFIVNRMVTVQADEYGENGTSNVTVAGTVERTDQLPANPAVGSIYKINTTNEYWQFQFFAGTSATIEWVAQTEWQKISRPTGYEIVETLPKTAPSGKELYLTRKRQTSNRKKINARFREDITETEPVYVTEYQKYKAVQVQAAVAAGSRWVKLAPNQLSKIVYGRSDPTGKATIHVTQSLSNTYYAIYVNGSKVTEYLTPKGVDAASSVPGTDQIAESLRAGLAGAGYTVARYGSTLSISNLSTGTTIMGTAGNGDKAIKTYTDTVNQFADLPPNEAPGRIVKVKGAVKDNGDDYFVMFNEGIWEETWAWNQGASPLARTMPHALVREADGTWTFQQWTWQGRAAGDANSNPHPSIVGARIHDMFLYANRLGFIADENVVLSEASNFENFYRTTLATLIDSDPIDMAVLNTGNDILYHAVPFNKDLLLMTDRNQYRFQYQNYLGPKNVQVQYTTSYNVSRNVHPINMGNSVYFMDDKETYQYAKLWEYYPKDNLTGDDADEATAPIPEYVHSDVKWMAASARMKSIVLFSEGEPNKLYLYKYYWTAERKVLNSWSKWEFPDCTRIYWGGFSGNYLYLVLARSDGVHLERIKFDEKVLRNDVSSRILVDRQTQKDRLTMSYNAASDTTTINLPWATDQLPEVIASKLDQPLVEDEVLDLRCYVTKVDADTITVPGNITDYTLVTVGIPYNLLFRFSTPYVRQPKGNGETVVLDGLRLQMRYITIEYHDTAYFKTRLSYPGREDVWTTFDGKITGSETFIVGTTPFVSGKFRIAIVGNNKDMTFELHNDSPFNCSFGSAEWLATHVPRAGIRT